MALRIVLKRILLLPVLGAGLMAVQELAAIPARPEARAGAPVRIEKIRVVYVFDEQGNYTRRTEQRYKILTQKGVEGWAHTSVTYIPSRMKRPVINVSATDSDGNVQRLDERTISERPAHPDAPDIYSDARELRAPIPSVRVGTTINEEITEQFDGQFFQGGVAHSLIFQSNIGRDEVELRLEYPASLPVRYEIRDADVQKSEETQGSRRILTFRGGPYPGVESLEADAPPEVPRWPMVEFSTGSSWSDLVRGYHARVRPRLDPGGLGSTDEATTGGGSSLEKANRILAFLNRRVRYVGLEFGEGAIIPSTPRETLARGYGDCKDKATLVIAMLARAGVEARLALLLTGPGEDTREGLPALNVFDHAILVIPGEKPIWIDPTSPYAKAGDLPAADQGRLALIIDPSTDRLVLTPANTHEENIYAEVREIRLAAQGPATIVETTSGRGVIEQSMRHQFSGDEKEIKEHLKGYVERTYAARKVGQVSYGSPFDLSRPFELRLEALEAHAGRTDILNASVALNDRVLFGWIPEAAFADDARRMDLIVPHPHRVDLRYNIIPPEGFRVSRLPDFPELDLGPVTLTRKAQAGSDGTISVFVTLTVPSRRWSPTDVESFRRGFKQYQRESADVVELEHVSEQLIAAKREAEGVRTLLDPRTGRPRTGLDAARLALHLADMGLGLPAREAADFAVRSHPDIALVHRIRGIVLMRDEFGRPLRQGYRRSEAIEAFGRAVELDPEDTLSRLQVAILKEYDEEGRRYMNRDSLEEAIKVYDSIDPEKLARYDKGNYANNVLFALMWANRPTDIRQRLRRLSVSQTPAVPAIVAETLLEDAKGGLKEAGRLNLRGEDRSSALAEAADVLVRRRRYQQAAELLEAAAEGSGRATTYSKRASVLRQVQPVHPLSLPTATAWDVVKRLLMLQFISDPRFRPVSDALIARSARHPEGGVNEFLKEFAEKSKPGPVPDFVFGDILGSFMRTDTEGDDQGGYRVRVVIQTPGGGPGEFSLFVIVDDGMLRVRATGDDLRDMGQQAVQFLQQGQPKYALRWMRWAEKLASRPSGDDPFRVHPWLTLMQANSPALEIAALSLCGARCGPEGLGALESGTASSFGEGTGRPSGQNGEGLSRDQIMAQAYMAHRKFEQALVLIRRLQQRFPQSAVLQSWEVGALAGLGQFTEVRAWVERRMAAANSEERLSLQAELINIDARLGRADRAGASCRELLSSGKTGAQIYNSCAWNSLFLGGATEETLKLAQEGNRLNGAKSASTLHTLAVVYAELGKVTEAKQTLLRLLESRPVSDVDWYIVGRMAESLGLPDAARIAYEKVKRPGEASPESTYELARRRLASFSQRP